MLRKLKVKDKINFLDFANKNNLNSYLFNDFIKQKKLAFISVDRDTIQGLIFLEKKDDVYLKLITDSKKIANNLLKILFWNYKKSIYAEIDEKNKLGFILKENGFRIVSKSDSIFLLYYNPIKGKKYNGISNNRKYNSSSKRVN